MFFSATKLPNLETFNRTDAFVALFLDDDFHRPVFISEVIEENNNPRWARNYILTYKFETIVQRVTVFVYHRGDTTIPLDRLEAHKLIGQASFRMSELMKELGGLELGLLFDRRFRGDAKVKIQAESVSSVTDIVYATFHAHELRNLRAPFGVSNPFYEISRLNEDGNYSLVYRSEYIHHKLNPQWREMRLPLITLCNGDYQRPLKFEIFDHYDDGNHRSMGETRITLTKMAKKLDHLYPIVENDRKGTKDYIRSGRKRERSQFQIGTSTNLSRIRYEWKQYKYDCCNRFYSI